MPLTFKFNDFAYDFMEKMVLPEKFLNLLKEKDFEESLNGEEMDALSMILTDEGP